jgi:hypothetical protein
MAKVYCLVFVAFVGVLGFKGGTASFVFSPKAVGRPFFQVL